MYKYGAKLLRVVDGDTADVMIDLGFDTWVKARLRFKGVDTWEKRTRDKAEKAKGLAATAFTKKYLEISESTRLSHEWGVDTCANFVERKKYRYNSYCFFACGSKI